jgi:phosphomevalonate kinase
MTEVVVHGKVMLSGEYAVLHGGTAVLVPAPHYAVFSECDRDSAQQSSIVLRRALYKDILLIEQYENVNGRPKVHVDSSQFFCEDLYGYRKKLGLGLSACEAVGAIALRFERAGMVWTQRRDLIRRYADEAHSAAQGGTGSGADVAACAYGKPIRFSRDDNGVSINEIERNQMTHPLPMHLVWTGVPSDTREHVRRFEDWLETYGESSKRLLSKLIDLSDQLAGLWFASEKDVLFDAIDRFMKSLRMIASSAGIPLMLPLHEELDEWARYYGGRAKPTGAGGGDMILLVGNLPVHHLSQLVVPLTIS